MGETGTMARHTQFPDLTEKWHMQKKDTGKIASVTNSQAMHSMSTQRAVDEGLELDLGQMARQGETRWE
jgi:hypothetical protein